jgi:serine/threonine protein kinase
METHVQPLRIGSLTLVRPLVAGPLAERWLAVSEPARTAHVAHRFRMGERSEERRLVSAVESLSVLAHPHLLPVEQFTLGIAGAAWVVTPFTGSHDGLVTLARLLYDKGGRMEPAEVELALGQVLEAIEYAHAAGVHHGALSADEIMVDRRGSLSLEHYGLRRRLTAATSGTPAEVAADEVRSVVELGYQLLTGLSAEEPRISASRLLPRLDRRWSEWLEEGLDPLLGFASAGEALSMLPGARREIEGRPSPVVSVIGRVRRALRTP